MHDDTEAVVESLDRHGYEKVESESDASGDKIRVEVDGMFHTHPALLRSGWIVRHVWYDSVEERTVAMLRPSAAEAMPRRE